MTETKKTRKKRKYDDDDDDGDEFMPSGDPGAGAGSGSGSGSGAGSRNVKQRLATDVFQDSKELLESEANEARLTEAARAEGLSLRSMAFDPAAHLRDWRPIEETMRQLTAARMKSALAYLAMYGVEPLPTERRVFVSLSAEALGYAYYEKYNHEQPGGAKGRVGAWLKAGNVVLATPATAEDKRAEKYAAPPWELYIHRVAAPDLIQVHLAKDAIPETTVAVEPDTKAIEDDMEKRTSGQFVNTDEGNWYDFFRFMQRLGDGLLYRKRVAVVVTDVERHKGAKLQEAMDWLTANGVTVTTLPLHKYLLQRFVIEQQVVRGGIENATGSSAGRGKLLLYNGPLTNLISEYAGTAGRCRVCERKMPGNAKYCSPMCQSTAVRRRGY